CCILIGSVRSPDQLPPHIRALRGRRHIPAALFQLGGALAGLAMSCSGPLLGNTSREILAQVRDADAHFLQWACRAVLAWHEDHHPPAIPVHHIHGVADPILPPRYTSPDVLVPGAGHMLSLTHADQVNQFLQTRLTACGEVNDECRIPNDERSTNEQ
ncbi:MAG: alpha/beta fold hydrolase, partial [Tepidisphaerales bacterium]